MDNLRLFKTEREFEMQKNHLSYPAASYLTELDEARFKENNLNSSLVDAWIFSGESNLSSIKEISGFKGNKLIPEGFSWTSLGSGFGGADFDFTNFEVENVTDPLTPLVINRSKRVMEVSTSESSYAIDITLYHTPTQLGEELVIPTYKIEVTGSTAMGTKLTYSAKGSQDVAMTEGAQVIPELRYTITQDDLNGGKFILAKYSLRTTSLTSVVLRLPLTNNGTLVFDGVDDYCYCNLDKRYEDYTVICRRKMDNVNGYLISSSNDTKAAFNFEGASDTKSYGSTTAVQIDTKEVSWQTKWSYNNQAITSDGINEISEGLLVGRYGDSFSKGCIYYIAIYGQSLTPEKIDREIKELDKLWLDRLTETDTEDPFNPVWYKESIVCHFDVFKEAVTNESLRVTNRLTDLSGNRRDMHLYNFAYNENGSGVKSNGKYIEADATDDYGLVNDLPLLNDFTIVFYGYHGGAYKDVTCMKGPNESNSGEFLFDQCNSLGGNPTSFRSFGGPLVNMPGSPRWNDKIVCMTKTRVYNNLLTSFDYTELVPGSNLPISTSMTFFRAGTDESSSYTRIGLGSFLLFNRSLKDDEIKWVFDNKIRG